MIDYKATGLRIRTRRKELGLTQEILAEKTNITASFYSQIETGSRKAGINTFVNIAQEVALSLDYIIFGVEVKSTISETSITLDEYEKKILYRIRNLSSKEKKYVLEIVDSFTKAVKNT